LAALANILKCEVIIGMEGGKVLTTAKAVAHKTPGPLIIAAVKAADSAGLLRKVK
jgi:glycerol dehydrogenase-like iron-containing ADH family enzyme